MDGPSSTPFPAPQPLGPVRAATSPEEGTPQSASTMVCLFFPLHTYPKTGRKLISNPPQASLPFSSGSSGGYYDSPTSTSSNASTLLWGGGSGSGGYGGIGRKDSTESAPASTEAMMLTKRETASSVVSPKHVNANSYCGRHSKEYLFGGKGFGDLWKAVTKK